MKIVEISFKSISEILYVKENFKVVRLGFAESNRALSCHVNCFMMHVRILVIEIDS